MTIPNLSDIMSDTDGSSASENNDSDSGTVEIPNVFDQLGADMDRVTRFFETRDSDRQDDLIALANILAGAAETEADGLSGDEAWTALANYNAGQYVHQLLINFANDRRDGEAYQRFSAAFYGDSVDPEEGTYNYWQRLCRDNGLKLDLYRVMFPEPTEHFPGEPVNVTKDSGLSKWDTIGLPHEDGARDTHVFVTMEWVENYADYADENGIPLPPAEFPSDAPAKGSDSDGDGGSPSVQAGDIDPTEYTVDELSELVADIDDVETLSELLTVERQNKARKTAKAAISDRLSEVAAA